MNPPFHPRRSLPLGVETLKETHRRHPTVLLRRPWICTSAAICISSNHTRMREFLSEVGTCIITHTHTHTHTPFFSLLYLLLALVSGGEVWCILGGLRRLKGMLSCPSCAPPGGGASSKEDCVMSGERKQNYKFIFVIYYWPWMIKKKVFKNYLCAL